MGRVDSWFPTFWLIFLSEVSPGIGVPCASSSFSINLPLLWPLSFPPLFTEHPCLPLTGCLLSATRCSSVGAFLLSCWICSHFPPFPHLCPSHLLCPLSFPSPPPLFFSSLFPSFLYRKSKVINNEIIPWFEDTHDLLRLLSWNKCAKHDDEMMKFLHYVIFINQHYLTWFSLESCFTSRKGFSLLLHWYPFSWSALFPFPASFPLESSFWWSRMVDGRIQVRRPITEQIPQNY